MRWSLKKRRKTEVVPVTSDTAWLWLCSSSGCHQDGDTVVWPIEGQARTFPFFCITPCGFCFFFKCWQNHLLSNSVLVWISGSTLAIQFWAFTKDEFQCGELWLYKYNVITAEMDLSTLLGLKASSDFILHTKHLVEGVDSPTSTCSITVSSQLDVYHCWIKICWEDSVWLN